MPSNVTANQQFAIPPGRRGNQFSQMQASDAEIAAATQQLNAGQPVTALPTQTWSLDQQRAYNERLTQFDRTAAATKLASEQAARDSAMLDQMSRVAKSSKDIAVALQQQDEIGFRNAVAAGVPAVQALTRYPRAASSSMVALAKAASPTEMAPAPSVVNLPGISTPGVRSGLHGEHFAFAPEGALGTGVGPELDVAKDPETGQRIGLWSRRGKNSWQLVVDPQEKVLTPGNQITRLSALQRALAYELNSGEAIQALDDPKDPKHQEYLDRKQKLRAVADQLEAMGKSAPAKAAPAAAGTNAAPRNAVRDPKTGKWKFAP